MPLFRRKHQTSPTNLVKLLVESYAKADSSEWAIGADKSPDLSSNFDGWLTQEQSIAVFDRRFLLDSAGRVMKVELLLSGGERSQAETLFDSLESATIWAHVWKGQGLVEGRWGDKKHEALMNPLSVAVVWDRYSETPFRVVSHGISGHVPEVLQSWIERMTTSGTPLEPIVEAIEESTWDAQTKHAAISLAKELRLTT